MTFYALSSLNDLSSRRDTEGPPTAITRRTARFDDVATDVETECLHRGVMVRSELVDQVLNARIRHVAELLRIGDRAALRYCPDDLAPQLPEQFVTALLEQPAGTVGPPTGLAHVVDLDARRASRDTTG